MKNHTLLPFAGSTRLHWWSAFFLCLRQKGALLPQTPEEEKLFYQAEVKYLRFGQLLPPEICAHPIPARYGRLSLAENATSWELRDMEALLDKGASVTLLVSLAGEMAALKKRVTPADMTSALHGAPALEWISLLIESLYQRDFTQRSRKLSFPLRILLNNLAEGEPGNQSFNDAYTSRLKKYLRTFFAAARVTLIKTAVQENPARADIDALALELGNVVGEIF